MLLVWFAAQPLLAATGLAGRVTLGLVLLAVLALGVLALAEGRRQRGLLAGLAVLVALATVGMVLRPFAELWPYGAIATLYAAFFAGVGWLLFLFVLRGHAPPRALLMAAVCVYLLAGVAWSNAYLALQIFSVDGGGAAFAGVSIGAALEDLDLAGRAFLYFSFVTLTTLGYGDITPLSDAARTLTSLEAVAGVLYVAIMIASLVGRSGDRGHEVDAGSAPR